MQMLLPNEFYCIQKTKIPYGDDIWKFENHQWIKLNSNIGVYAYGVADAILVPEDFVIPDSTTPRISTITPIATQTV